MYDLEPQGIWQRIEGENGAMGVCVLEHCFQVVPRHVLQTAWQP